MKLKGDTEAAWQILVIIKLIFLVYGIWKFGPAILSGAGRLGAIILFAVLLFALNALTGGECFSHVGGERR